ncbi:hypothetical protein I4U23_001628 [Adineta vaga]|nr:hypothetical protein I4U23_001628 [Adineta vaga]
MAYRIRRESMEHLDLYDLDKINNIMSFRNRRLPPPIPAPRKHRRQLPTNVTFERYHFLCNMNRHKTDPIYAAVPMFKTLPPSIYIKPRRQLLGTYFPTNIIRPLKNKANKSTESENVDENDYENKRDEVEQISNDDDDDDDHRAASDNDDDDNDTENQSDESSSSSSSSSRDNDDDGDDILDDDNNDNQTVVEQIFNRDKN